ncbi:MAG: glycoside hydrolase family 3 N-terminal domain-containing protein, partial [Rhizobiaceae bacterium]
MSRYLAKLVAGALLAFAAATSVKAGGKPGVDRNLDEQDINQRARAIVGQMTVQEKAAQLALFFALPGDNNKAAADKNAANGAGALLFVTDPTEVNRLQRIAVEQTRMKIPLLFAMDVLHGLSTIFPAPLGMAASWDPAMVERSNAIAAAEARAVGIGWTFGPMIDISRDPRWGRMVEGSGEDPYLVSAMAEAQVRGFQGRAVGTPGRVLATPKHFAGYGAPDGGRDFDEVSLSDEQLHNVHLPPFKAAIDAGAGSIMSAYMPLNGIPAAANTWLLTDVLRKDWHFKGFVVTDNSAVSALQTHGLAVDKPDAVARALKAGTDMEMTFARSSFAEIPELVAAGKVDPRRLDEAVCRVIEAKIRLGLFEKPFVDEAQAARVLRRPQHIDAARISAERSAVLLRNDGGLLPLDRNKVRSIAVLGPLADSPRDALGPWVFNQAQPVSQSLLAGIRAKFEPAIKITYDPGVAAGKRMSPNPMTMMDGQVVRPAPADDVTGIAAAVAATRDADVALVVVGETYDMVGELGSTSSLSLPGRQQDLLDSVVATGKPVVVLIMNGRPLDLKDTKAQAILDIWYPGSRGGDAVANLLAGDSVPGGKLPFTWVRNAGQAPLTYNRLTTHSPRGADSRYWNEPGAPTWRFGHGLSYTTFAYSDIAVDRSEIARGESANVTFRLTNTGPRAGDEVAQLYLHQSGGTAARPVRELKGFQRVTLKPGESRTLSFRIGPDELRYWNAASRSWVIDTAKVEIAVGGDSTAAFGPSFNIR